MKLSRCWAGQLSLSCCLHDKGCFMHVSSRQFQPFPGLIFQVFSRSTNIYVTSTLLPVQQSLIFQSFTSASNERKGKVMGKAKIIVGKRTLDLVLKLGRKTECVRACNLIQLQFPCSSDGKLCYCIICYR